MFSFFFFWDRGKKGEEFCCWPLRARLGDASINNSEGGGGGSGTEMLDVCRRHGNKKREGRRRRVFTPRRELPYPLSHSLTLMEETPFFLFVAASCCPPCFPRDAMRSALRRRLIPSEE